MERGLVSTELAKAIQEERLLEAQQRRTESARRLSPARSQLETMRMAFGPGIQFGGVTGQLLETVTAETCVTC